MGLVKKCPTIQLSKIGEVNCIAWLEEPNLKLDLADID